MRRKAWQHAQRSKREGAGVGEWVCERREEEKKRGGGEEEEEEEEEANL